MSSEKLPESNGFPLNDVIEKSLKCTAQQILFNFSEIYNACEQMFYDRNKELYRLSLRENKLMQIRTQIMCTHRLISRLADTINLLDS